jgi:hypothetical protein
MSWRRKLLAGVIVVAVLVVLCFAGLYGYAWKQRLLAGKLLAAVRTMQPGVSTQTEYEASLRPLAKHALEISQQGADGRYKELPGGYYVSNLPAWVDIAINRVVWMRKFETRGVYFAVKPEFQDGILSNLNMEETQTASGHPPGATVRVRSMKYRDISSDYLDENGGYLFQSMQVGDGTPTWEQFVTLDERATPSEREAAMNFNFACFTAIHNCMDGGKMLRPAPNRAQPEK